MLTRSLGLHMADRLEGVGETREQVRMTGAGQGEEWGDGRVLVSHPSP